MILTGGHLNLSLIGVENLITRDIPSNDYLIGR
jgi:hypothetical protein